MSSRDTLEYKADCLVGELALLIQSQGGTREDVAKCLRDYAKRYAKRPAKKVKKTIQHRYEET